MDSKRVHCQEESDVNERKRLSYVDVCRGIAMMLVVISHSRTADTFIAKMCWCSHVPLFFVLSGYICSDFEENTKKFIYKKVKQLLYPYITLSLLAIVLEFILYIFGIRPFEGVKIALQTMVTFDGNGPLWFISTLFLSEIIYHYCEKYCKNLFVIVIIIAIIGSSFIVPYVKTKEYLILYTSFYILIRSLYGVSFLLLGHLFKKYKK